MTDADRNAAGKASPSKPTTGVSGAPILVVDNERAQRAQDSRSPVGALSRRVDALPRTSRNHRQSKKSSKAITKRLRAAHCHELGIWPPTASQSTTQNAIGQAAAGLVCFSA